jgi:hypothetical protein
VATAMPRAASQDIIGASRPKKGRVSNRNGKPGSSDQPLEAT